jgi:hypothetical protein
MSGCRPKGWRRLSSEPLEIGEPELHERPHCVLQPGVARSLERLLEALAHLGHIDALLETIVAYNEQVLDFGAGLVS